MKQIIGLSNVTKQFDGKMALRSVNLQVKKGEIFGLLGPSGAGKTTMIKLLTGQLIPSSGTIHVHDYIVDQFRSVEFRQSIGILSDNSALYERLTVEDNLTLFCKLYGVPLSNMDDILDDVQLSEERKKTVAK